ncbi:MAG: MBL fold metallo-hydrolase [Acidobacteriia bacterium]|nr:MBL fold metallo-hydrolase [Terriglobia bacterium]
MPSSDTAGRRILNLPLYRVIVPTPFHVGPINVYVITEPEVVLIDVGPKTEEARGVLKRGLESLGLSFSKVRKIFITHGHPDHYGLAAEVAHQAGAGLFASPLDSAEFQHRTDPGFYERMYREAEVPVDAVNQFEDQYRYILSMTDPVPTFTPVLEGQTLLCGDEILEVIHTPGHTPGSVCFFLRGLGLLIAADTVIKRITPNPILNEDPIRPGQRFPSLMSYLSSLEKLRRLRPRQVCSGHGDDVEAFDTLFEAIIHHHDKRQSRILELLGDRKKTVWALARELFPQVDSSGLFLALSEAYAHADYLEAEGKIRGVDRDGVRRLERV